MASVGAAELGLAKEEDGGSVVPGLAKVNVDWSKEFVLTGVDAEVGRVESSLRKGRLDSVELELCATSSKSARFNMPWISLRLV